MNATNGLQTNDNEDSKIEMYDIENLDAENKELYLIKLPNELIKYQKKHNDLSLDFKSLKHGDRFKVQNIEYEAMFTKAKVPFSCLCKTGDSTNAINKFKSIIQIKRCLDIPKPVAPSIVDKHVAVPDSISNYLKQKKKSIKRLNGKKSSKNKIS